MTVLLDVLLIAVSFLFLWKGAQWLVESAARIARRLGVSELVIGLTVVAFGTSAPEFAVSVSAALRGEAAVSVGNVVGSNIFNIGFILGGCGLVGAIRTSRHIVWRDGGILLVTTVALLGMFANGRVDRWEGVLLVAALAAYLLLLFRKKEVVIEEEIPTEPAHWWDLPLLLLGLGFVIGGAHLLVFAASNLAQRGGMSPWAIGMTVVAAGTSIPELVVSFVAILKGRHGISAGNLVGSNIFNTLGVLGVAGVIQLPAHPLNVDSAAFTSVALLVVLTLAVMVFMRTGWRVSRWEGAVLLVGGLAMWIHTLMAGR